MTTYARISGGIVQELFTPPDGVNIADCFPPALAATFVAVPSGVLPAYGWTYDGKAFAAPLAPAGPALSAVQASLNADIDTQAEAQRLRYITPGAGQMGTYLLKQSQAQLAQSAQTTTDAGKSAGQLAAVYPDLANEIGITVDPTSTPPAPATDIYGVARAVMVQAKAWQPLRLAIENTRLATKKAIAAATTAAAAQAAHDSVIWPSA